MVQRRILNRIDSCEWEIVRDAWLEYVRDIKPVGSKPHSALNAVDGFREAADEAGQLPANECFVRVTISGFHRVALHQGIYLLHKAWHVLGAAEAHAAEGLLSWSLSSAYHAAFFAAKANLIFLGYPFVEDSNNQILAKLFPTETRRKGGMRQLEAVAPETVELTSTKHLQHREVWSLFQRALNVARVPNWPSAAKKWLSLLKPADFASERNAIHYKPETWPYEDLHVEVFNDNFGVALSENKRWEFPDGGFSLCLGLTVIELGVQLLRDLCEVAPVLQPELELFKETATKRRHPRYSASDLVAALTQAD